MSFNVELISKMRNGLYVLVAMGCLAFSSCSKDSLGLDSAIEQRAATTQVVKMSLGAGMQLFGRESVSEDEAGGFRALERQNLQFEIRDGSNKFIVGDNGQNTSMASKRGHMDKEDLKGKAANIKFFVQIRKKSDKSLVGSRYGTWLYRTWNNGATSATDWRLDGQEIALTGVTPGTDELQVRVVAGGNLDADAKKINIDKPEYQEIDLSKTNKVSLPVPFASKWIDLSYNAAKSQYTTVGDSTIKLKPLGTLLVTTVRSSMSNKTASLTGVRYVTNALAFQGEFSLDGSDDIPFKAVGGHPYTTEVTQDTFYEITYSFKDGKLTPGATPNDKIFVSWGLPTGKPKADPWATETNKTGDITRMISMPQTHVYAEGVTASGKLQTNFKVAPVMGTNYNFGHGKSTAMNCELYDMPKQVLGYFAKYTVNAEGTGFDTSHDENQVSLVNWKIAKEFLKGKELVGADGQKATFRMGNEAMAVYTGNYFSSVWSENNADSYYRLLVQNDPSKGAVVARAYPVLINYGSDGNANIQEGTRSLMQVYIPARNRNANYMIIGRELNPKEYAGRGRSRNKEQAVIRIESINGVVRKADGKLAVGSTRLTSVALGKYFIGTSYSPIYKNKPAYDEDLWRDADFMEGRVQRRMPAAGHYANSSWNPSNPTAVADVDNVRPDNLTRDEVGAHPFYWFWIKAYDYAGPSRLMKRLEAGMNPSWTGADWLNDMKDSDIDPSSPKGDPYSFKDSRKGTFLSGANNILFFPENNGGTLRAVVRDAKYMWMALWPIANKYQGDDEN